MLNPTSTKTIKINGKLHVALPDSVIEKLEINEGQNVEFGITSNVTIWKSENIDVPTDIFDLLLKQFKTEGYVFHWLNKKQRYFQGKTPLSMLTSEAGKKEVFGLINRLQRGDLS